MCVTVGDEMSRIGLFGIGLSTEGSPGGAVGEGWLARGGVAADLVKHISNHQVPCCGAGSTVIATMASASLDGTAHHTRCSIKLLELRHTFWCECFVCVRVRAALSTL